MTKKPKPTFAFRLDPDLVEVARDQGINLAPLIEAAIANKIRAKKCPYCGHVKTPKKKTLSD